MPRVNVVATTLSRAGHLTGAAATTPAEVAGDATNHHDMTNTGQEFLVIRNSGASQRTVTLEIPETIDGQAVTNKTFTLEAGETKLAGPFPTPHYNQGTAGEAGKMYFRVSHAELRLQAFKVSG